MRSFVLAVLVLLYAPAWAQDYPSKPIRLVIPFAPGSLADAVPRLMQPALEASLGQRLVIEHRPGAGGNVGAQAVVSAPPDGYTLLMAATNNLVINQFVFQDMQFDPLVELVPVSLVVEVPLILQTHPAVPAKSLGEFIAYAKVHPGKLNYGSPSTGTLPHLAMEIFARSAGLDLVHVPYKGGAPAMNALIANDVQAMLIGYATTAGQVKSGQVRPIAVASSRRLAALPQVPTFAEAGFPQLQAAVPGNWWGMAGPKGTPGAIVQQLSKQIAAVLADPAVRQKYEDLGLTPVGSTPEQFASGLPEQAQKWRAVLQKIGKVTN